MNIQAIKQRFGIIGRSTSLDNSLSTAVRVAPTELTVLVSGESGVGKEAFSKIIHALSPRKHNTSIAINCGAIPEGTINSELFGHERGAFTGATSERKGYFETVNSGTIFLDEISEMPLDTQAFLLRVLESGEFLRVGSSKVLKTDVRVIAATNIDLMDRVRAGKFREDLYYRLSTVPIHVPALRHRREDIYMLFRKFTLDFAEKYRTDPIELTPDAKSLLERHNWPGNIRELKNVAEQMSVLSEERSIDAAVLETFIPSVHTSRLPALHRTQGNGDGLQEREILYKLLFDMKSDLNDLKSLIFELVQNNDLQMPDRQLKQLARGDSGPIREIRQELKDHLADATKPEETYPIPERQAPPDLSKPIILPNTQSTRFSETEEVDENLSIEEMEKELIGKALNKHKGRRKDAAQDLGISERTLYRKIKQYELQ
ncbi:MAG: sigma-54-dependent Fis family transcriptional regulator [Saprospiraceae bacterium]|nr:sigma-54-dependent Fis family transcriptional regulator [Saprospiraceae bacterium]